jgi:hypothetical protein
MLRLHYTYKDEPRKAIFFTKENLEKFLEELGKVFIVIHNIEEVR